MMRRVLIIAMVGLLAAGILTGYNVAFAQDITSDAEKLDQGANVIWMVGAFLVFFMQAGFAFLGAGLIRSKNTTNYMTRTKTQAYLAYSFIIGAVIYPLYGHWVWGGGWLGNLEVIGLPAAADYAGSGVVHAVGGFIALAGAVVVGARKGKFNADGSANVLSGHNIPYVVIGTFILFFGWFGFNINTGDSIGLNAVNTLLAGATGAVVALYIQLVRTGRTDNWFGDGPHARTY